MTVQVNPATELDQIKRCAPVMPELRASLTDSGSTLPTVRHHTILILLFGYS